MGVRGKLILPILLAFVGYAGVLHYYWAPLQIEHAKETFLEQTKKEFSAMESGLIRNLLTRDYSALFATLDTQGKLHSHDWLNLSLFNENNKKIYPLYRQETKHPDHDFLIPYEYKLKIDNDTLGSIKLHLNWFQEHESTRARILQLELILLLTAFILCLLLLLWQQKMIKAPIHRLQSVAEKMAEGDFSISLTVSGNDEISNLTRSFDFMRQEIMRYQQKLRTAHEETKNALSMVASKNTELEKEISERRKIEEQLANMAMYDSLTSLPNRRMLLRESSKMIAAAKRNHENAIFLFIDLDGFKQINDRHGHEAGDAVLKEVAMRLHSSVREIDIVGRFGGDEFVIALPGCDTQLELDTICSRIIEEVKKPVTSIDTVLSVGTSIGIAEYPADATESNKLISLADEAMYVAKQSGGNQCAYASAHSNIVSHTLT